MLLGERHRRHDGDGEKGEANTKLVMAANTEKTGPDAPKPTKLDQFLASHPQVAKSGASAATPAISSGWSRG